MNSLADNILADREKRRHFVSQVITVGKTVVVLKANIPGPEKNIQEVKVMLNLVRATLPFTDIEAIHFLNGADGEAIVYVLNDSDTSKIKRQTMQIEEETSLGRLIDLDVYGINQAASQSRHDLRKCFICEQPAFVCSRNHTHSLTELLGFVRKTVRLHLMTICQTTIGNAIDDELKLSPKFGLVTPFDSGSHCDMNYQLMIKAKEAIIQPLTAMFFTGYDANGYDKLFTRVRQIGYEAEQMMMRATNNVNAYKGLIFSLGLAITAAGYAIGHNLSFSSIFDSVRIMTEKIMDEFSSENGSFGLEAWKRYGFGGARQEAFLGLPSVQMALPILTDFSSKNLMMTLIAIINKCEDTVLLKRCGSLENYHIAKRKIASIYEYDELVIDNITEWCKQRKISFGGAADLLVVTCFLKRLQNIYIFA